MLGVVEGTTPQLLCERDGCIYLLILNAWGSEVRKLRKVGAVILPAPTLDGSVLVLQVSPEQGANQRRELYCDLVRLCAGRVLVAHDELVASEVSALDVDRPSSAFLTFVQLA